MATSEDTLDLECGIDVALLADWVTEDLPSRPSGYLGWLVQFEEGVCAVDMAVLPPRELGSVALPRTRFIAQGSSDAIDRLHRLFILRFASAGG